MNARCGAKVVQTDPMATPPSSWHAKASHPRLPRATRTNVNSSRRWRVATVLCRSQQAWMPTCVGMTTVAGRDRTLRVTKGLAGDLRRRGAGEERPGLVGCFRSENHGFRAPGTLDDGALSSTRRRGFRREALLPDIRSPIQSRPVATGIASAPIPPAVIGPSQTSANRPTWQRRASHIGFGARPVASEAAPN